MAERRMMSKKITDTDAFLDMPLSTQALYFHFIQNADDDGFVGNPNSIIRKIGANKNDYDLLIAKRFIITFETGICVIKHWRIHNYIQNDRYTPTTYLKEKSMLAIEENKAYTEQNPVCIQDVSTADTQYSIDKISINNIISDEQEIFNYYNSKNIIIHRELTEEIQKSISKALKKYSVEELKTYIDRYDKVIKDNRYFFDYKWGLKDLLDRKNGISAFTDDGSKWIDYCDKVGIPSLASQKEIKVDKNGLYEI